MASYKVLQDIEAEDKLIGPLTLRQCIYAGIALLSGWLMFIVIHKHAAVLALIFFPFFAFGTFFAVPWKSEQPTEVWALARIRFMLKPRKRIWDQSGVKELVTVTAPKLAEDPRRGRNLSESEVHSRLKALADTIDSRGWAVKNAPIDMYSASLHGSDRLVAPTSAPPEVTGFNETQGDDMFDDVNNPVARQLEEKINATTSARRQQLMAMVSNPQPQPVQPTQQTVQNYWYGTQTQTPQAAPYMPPALSTSAGPVSVMPMPTMAAPVAVAPTAEEVALMQNIRAQQIQPQPNYAHLRVVQPLSAPAGQVMPTLAQQPVQNPPASVTPPVNPAILELANNNDLNVATIAREAHHLNPDTNDEVIVSLH